MSTLVSTVLATPARRRSDLPRRILQRWFAPRAPKAVTAVQLGMAGEPCLAARVEWLGERPGQGPKLRLAQIAEGGPQDLVLWRERGWFAGAQAVLVLANEQRHLLTLDRPEVPDAELKGAVRFPLAEALDIDPSAVLASALPLPQINATQRSQVLAVGCRLETAREHLAQLAKARIKVRQIDVADSALRGIVLLESQHHAQGEDAEGWVVLSHLGSTVGIALVWRGQFCAVRTLALPQRSPRDSQEFQEQLALHIQRTVDTFERQATEMAIRKLRVHLPGLGAEMNDMLAQALPLAPQPFDIGSAMQMDAITQEFAQENSALSALACVAATRLLDARSAVAVPASAPPAVQEQAA